MNRTFCRVAASFNKAVQTDYLRGVCLVVSLSLHFTAKQPPYKLRLS